MVGHCNSAYLGLRGGRGLATIFGILFFLLPIPAVLTCLVWACLSFWGLSTKPGALSAAGALPLFTIAWTFHRPEHTYYLYLVAFFSMWTMWEHRDSLNDYMNQAKAAKTPPAEEFSPEVPASSLPPKTAPEKERVAPEGE